jgi:hypothetical protein
MIKTIEFIYKNYIKPAEKEEQKHHSKLIKRISKQQ